MGYKQPGKWDATEARKSDLAKTKSQTFDKIMRLKEL